MIKKKPLTHEEIEALPTTGKRYDVSGWHSGLILRVGPSGLKNWSFIYPRRFGEGVRRVTLGRFPYLTLDKAVKETKRLCTVSEEVKVAAKEGDKAPWANLVTTPWKKKHYSIVYIRVVEYADGTARLSVIERGRGRAFTVLEELGAVNFAAGIFLALSRSMELHLTGKEVHLEMAFAS